MKKVTLEDILPLPHYERVRDDFRRRIIELKSRRRLQVGDKVSLLFENRDTVIFQIQEMLRAEKITELGKVQDEIEVYNSLIPGERELSATLFLEIEDQAKIREELLRFLGLDEVVYLRIGQGSIHARFEPGHSKEDKISAVQYVRFPFTEEQVEAFALGEEAEIRIDHRNYKAKAAIGAQMRKALIEDLRA